MTEKEIRGVGRCRPVQTVATFLLKTFEILERPDFEHIICWDRDEEGFVVKNLLQFTNEILPKYFRHNNFSSFVRQLNMYDFHKIKQNNDNFVFKNPLFRKGAQHLLKDIKRKASRRTDMDRRVPGTSSSNQPHNLTQNSLREARVFLGQECASSSTLFEKSINLLESCQLSRFNQLAIRRQQNAEAYKKLMSMLPTCETPQILQCLYSIRKISTQIMTMINVGLSSIDVQCQKKLSVYTNKDTSDYLMRVNSKIRRATSMVSIGQPLSATCRTYSMEQAKMINDSPYNQLQ